MKKIQIKAALKKGKEHDHKSLSPPPSLTGNIISQRGNFLLQTAKPLGGVCWCSQATV